MNKRVQTDDWMFFVEVRRTYTLFFIEVGPHPEKQPFKRQSGDARLLVRMAPGKSGNHMRSRAGAAPQLNHWQRRGRSSEAPCRAVGLDTSKYADPALNIVTVGIYPLVTDAALWAVGYAVGYAVMRLIAGPARDDPFARKS